MYNTGNPVPSDKLEDLSDDGKVFDTLVTQTEGTTADRLGRTRRVFQQILMDMGFHPLSGSFQAGATITDRNQTLYDEVSHVFYAWGGALPKVVPVGSTPATSGGIGVGAWSDKTDLMLRNELVGDDGLQHVAGKLLTYGINRALYAHLNDLKVSVLNANGVVADGVTDVRAGVESLILTLSALTYGATIYFPKGKYLLNSYTSNSSLQSAFAQILPIRSNIHIELDDNAELVVGDFFDDKNFTLFEGLNNAATPSNSSPVVNSHFYGGTISFSGETSKMRTGYKLRLGVRFGRSENTSVRCVTFKNGDLSNCIVGGFETYGKYHTVENCRFIDLVQDADSGVSANIDFTACYCAAEKSKVINCDFYNSSRRGKEIASAVELHKSYSHWAVGSIYGYRQGGYIVSTPKETNVNIGCSVSHISGAVTNNLIDLWLGDDCRVVDPGIKNNVIRTHDRDETMTDPRYYGACGIVGRPGEVGVLTGISENVEITNNVFTVSNTVPSSLSNCIISSGDVRSWNVHNNKFSAKHLIWLDPAHPLTINSLKIRDNLYNTDAMDVGSVFAALNVDTMIYCDIDIKLSAPIALSKVLSITAINAGSGNRIKVHDENTSQIPAPVALNTTFLAGGSNITEYPEDLTFFVPAATGTWPWKSVNLYTYHKQATLIDKKTMPADAILCGQLTNTYGELCSLGYFPTSKGGSNYVGRVRLSSFR